MNNMYPVSVVLVTHNSEKVIADALDSVLECNVSEVIVVDCGSDDSTHEIVTGKQRVQLISIGNEGYGRGNNAGIALATQDFVLILNPDVLITLVEFEKLFNFCSTLANPSIVAPKMYHQSGVNKVYRRDSQFVGPRKYVDKVCGAAMMFPRTLFQQLNGFDPNIFLYFEETDLCYRAKKIGSDILVCGLAEVEHSKSGSTPSSSKYEFLRGWHDGWSKLYFVSKCSNNKIEKLFFISKTLIQTYIKIITKGISKNLDGQRRERNKLLGMKAFIHGDEAFGADGKARFTDK